MPSRTCSHCTPKVIQSKLPSTIPDSRQSSRCQPQPAAGGRMHVHPIPPDEAEGEVKAHYDWALESDGYLQNQELLFGLNPAAKEAWRGLVRAIGQRMDKR